MIYLFCISVLTSIFVSGIGNMARKYNFILMSNRSIKQFNVCETKLMTA